MQRTMLACVLVFMVVGVTVAQEKPAVTGALATPPIGTIQGKADPAPVPTVPDQDQQAFTILTLKAQVQAEMMAAMQKELDSTNAEVGRLVGRLQKPDFDLSRDQKTGRLVYAAKPAPKAEK